MEYIDFFKKNKAESFSEYISLNRLINSHKKSNILNLKHSINLALVASSATNGFQDVLSVQCAKHDIDSNIYISEYNQYAQEILNAKSSLYKFNPELIFINLDIMTLSGEIYFNPYELNQEQLEIWNKETSDFLINIIDSALKNSSGDIIISSLQIPNYSPLGLVESKQNFGFLEAVKSINFNLAKYIKKTKKTYLFDYDLFLSNIGKKNIFDPKMYYLGDLKLKTKFIPELCFEYARYAKAKKVPQKKCLVLDLDNTLWGGILGEDGIDGINLGISCLCK